MIIKVREYRTFITIKTYEYTLDVPDKETASDLIARWKYPNGIVEPSVPTVETSTECDYRNSFVVNEDGLDGDELYYW